MKRSRDRINLADPSSTRTAADELSELVARSLEPRDDVELAGRDDAERSLRAFTKQAWHIIYPMTPFVDGWHIGCICEHLEAMARLEITKLVINAPPRHCKSGPACVFLPCWVWTRSPAVQWIFSAFDEDLLDRDQDFCRRIVRSPWYQARWGHQFSISPGQNRIDEFWNTRGGYRLTATSTNPPLGRGAEWAVADDPNGLREIKLVKLRKKIIEMWDEGFSTRYNDPANFRRLVIQQRVGVEDLSGWLKGRGYECLNLPAEYEPARYFFPLEQKADPDANGSANGAANGAPHDPDPRGRRLEESARQSRIEPTSLQRRRPELIDGPGGSGRTNEGDLLWPERFTTELLREQKETMGTGWFGPYQQRPTADQGDVFDSNYFRSYDMELRDDGIDKEGRPRTKWWVILNPDRGPDERVETPADVTCVTWYQVFDTAKKLTESAKYTACVTFGSLAIRDQTNKVIRRVLLVHDSWRNKLTIPEQLPVIQELRKGRGDFDVKTRRWRVQCELRPWPSPVGFQFVEDAGSGEGILQQATVDGIPLEAIPTEGQSKEARALQASSLYERGVIFHRRNMPLLGDLEDELILFPGGEFSDQADCVSYGAILFNRHRFLTRALAGMYVSPTIEELAKKDEENTFKYADVTIRFPDD